MVREILFGSSLRWEELVPVSLILLVTIRTNLSLEIALVLLGLTLFDLLEAIDDVVEVRTSLSTLGKALLQHTIKRPLRTTAMSR